MKLGSLTAWTTLLCCAAALVQGHQDGAPARPETVVRAVRAPAGILLDGRLDDLAWIAAEPVSGFRQRDPQEGQPATERTELRIAYDADALYVGARMLDSDPSGIVRRLSRRDDEPDADRIVVYLDPRHDHRNGFQFWVSAAGVQRDAVIFNDSWDDASWDGVWQAAVSVDDQGWTAELRIPFSQLRFAEAERHVWGINAARYIQRKNETDWLQLVPKKESGLASRFVHLEGLEGLHPRKHLALLPYVVSRGEFVAPARAGDPFNDGSRLLAAVGLDVKYGLSSNLTLDATVNPDFGQVEVDPAVVNLTDFETFFDEKRPFFIEGSQTFTNFGRNGSNNFWGFNRSEPDLFYSRRIGRAPGGTAARGEFVHVPSATTILGAGKVTGRLGGGWTVGVLEAVTAREDAKLSDGLTHTAQQVEPLTSYFVARAHREGDRVGVGAMATSVLRDLPAGELADVMAGRSWVGGVDGYVLLGGEKDWAITGRVAASRLEGTRAAIERAQRAPQRYFQRPDAAQVELNPLATSLSGWTGSLNLNRQSGTVRVNSSLWGTSPGFESNDLGFNSRSDRWGGHALVEYRNTETGRVTRSRWAAVSKWYALNYAGERQGDGLHAFWEAQLLNYWWIGGNGWHRWRALDDRLTRGGPSVLAAAGNGASLWFRSDTRKRLVLRFEGNYFGSEFGTSERVFSSTLELKPSSSVQVSLGPSLYLLRSPASWVRSVEDATAVSTFGRRYVFGQLRQTEAAMTARVNWIMSPTMSLQVYAQPLVSVGDYEGFRELARPRTFDFGVYGAEGSTIARAGGTYTADPDGAGPAPTFTFADPDFNFKSLRFNAIFRWEWRPGSTLYAAWTQQREDLADPGDFQLTRDARHLFEAQPDDVLLVKVSYRFGR